MVKFLNAEKKRQAAFKGNSAYFSEAARADGAAAIVQKVLK